MQVLDVSKPVMIELLRKGKDAGTIVVAPEDRLYLDGAGVEFEHRLSGRRRFIPWSQIVEMYQDL